MELSNEELVKRLNSTRVGSVWEALDITVVALAGGREFANSLNVW